jgi:hypothetical protein
MKVKPIIILLACAVAQAGTETITLRGWFADEACARGRAAGGVFTGANPECAKRCVQEGKKIVFIDPDSRRVLDISNQDAAHGNIGDEVEVVGSVDSGNRVLHIDSLKLISRGVADCERRKPKQE